MERILIEPSAPLSGSVEVSGAKNSALPILAACLLTEDQSIIERVPRVTDVDTMAEILRGLGVTVSWQGEALVIHPGRYDGWMTPYEQVSRMRASVCVLGSLLAKQGRAKVSMPGGCVLGERPIDLHLKGLRALGASVSIEHGYVIAKGSPLRGATVRLGGPRGSSVLASANVMMAATLATGCTVIEQAACEPELVDLANFLLAMGAKISGHGTPLIRVEGVKRLRGARVRIIPDRIEAGTFMVATAMVGGDVQVVGADPAHLGMVIDKLREAGVTIEQVNGALRVRSDRMLRAIEVTTLPFPGFPTDLQAQITAMMTVSQGVSLMVEKVYPERFMHVAELNRMGAQVSREGPSAIVKGITRLSGAPVMGSDLRAAAALVVAGLAAENHTVLYGVEHLDRGYGHLEQKLMGLGAVIRRERSEDGGHTFSAARDEEDTASSNRGH